MYKVNEIKKQLNYLVYFCKAKAEKNKDDFNLLWIKELTKIVGSAGNTKWKLEKLTASDIDSLNTYLDIA